MLLLYVLEHNVNPDLQKKLTTASFQPQVALLPLLEHDCKQAFNASQVTCSQV
jgi:hypothetical protein